MNNFILKIWLPMVLMRSKVAFVEAEEGSFSYISKDNNQKRQLPACASTIQKTYSQTSDGDDYDTGADTWTKASRTFTFNKCTHLYTDRKKPGIVSKCQDSTYQSSKVDCEGQSCVWNTMPLNLKTK